MPDFDTWTRLLLEPGRERNLLRANSSGLPFNSVGGGGGNQRPPPPFREIKTNAKELSQQLSLFGQEGGGRATENTSRRRTVENGFHFR